MKINRRTGDVKYAPATPLLRVINGKNPQINPILHIIIMFAMVVLYARTRTRAMRQYIMRMRARLHQ